MTFTIDQQNQVENYFQAVFTKVWDDPSYKERLISNPEKTIEETTGESLPVPEDVQFVVNDQTDPSVIYINIPPKFELKDFELTDEQLELVAGGEGIVVGTYAASYAIGIGIGLAGLGIAWVLTKVF